VSLVFADAFYFVARLNRRDQHHERVLKFSQDFRARLLTTDCTRSPGSTRFNMAAWPTAGPFSWRWKG